VTVWLSLRERQIFVYGTDFRFPKVRFSLRVTQYLVTGKIYTLVSGCQHIEYKSTCSRNRTMGAARTGFVPGIRRVIKYNYIKVL